MMKIFLLVLSLLLLSRFSFAQNPIPNYSFENWTAGEPDEWQTANSIATFITEVSPGLTGSSAAKGEVQSVFGLDVPPLLLSAGNGFTVSQSYSTLFFYYKFNSVGSATLTIGANFYNIDGTDAGAGVALISAAATEFTLGSVALAITGAPVRCIISATITDQNGFPSEGNYFILDDFSFDNPIGVPTIPSANYFISVPAPNPATQFATIKFQTPIPGKVTMKVLNILGKEVKSTDYGNRGTDEEFLSIDLSDLDNGSYLLLLSSPSGMLQQKLLVSR